MSDDLWAAAENLVRVWRDADPDLWCHMDDARIVEAIEQLARVVEARKKEPRT